MYCSPHPRTVFLTEKDHKIFMPKIIEQKGSSPLGAWVNGTTSTRNIYIQNQLKRKADKLNKTNRAIKIWQQPCCAVRSESKDFAII